MSLGQRLRSARKNKNMTLTEVATTVGTTQSYLSKIERGERTNPSLDLINDLAKIYDVELKWLIEGIDTSELEENLEIKRKKERLVEMIKDVKDEDIDKLMIIIEAFITEGRD